MFLMLAEVLELATLSERLPGSRLAEWISFHTSHVPWRGFSLHDLIQPGFTFLVGVALPFSLSKRLTRGDSWLGMAWHALWRSCILIFLGIALRSLGRDSTNFFFVDTLTQIGFGYFFAFLLCNRSSALITVVGGFILLSYWQLFALWPLPDVAFSWQAVGVPYDWPHLMDGFAAHWNKNMNPAWYFDTWFMNLFPREEPFEYNAGGYCTLNCIPTLVTMLLGIIAGKVLASASKERSSFPAVLVSAGVGMIAVACLLDYFGYCPIVKRIWTPSWTLLSAGICFLALAALHCLCDRFGKSRWAFPLMVIGANSIVAYIMSWTVEGPIKAFFLRHVGSWPFAVLGTAWEPVLLGSAVLGTMWLVLYWLYRNRLLVRI
ncbi:MAG TPA: DUF5009 domain-containing protein [Planctomycetaceae bacterium]|nr:DUF5009 domain-containing protein [Planctomycetaceae bacterium]